MPAAIGTAAHRPAGDGVTELHGRPQTGGQHRSPVAEAAQPGHQRPQCGESHQRDGQDRGQGDQGGGAHSR
ncbi:hypothetical protein AB0L44_13855 [Nonomuraea wenchangensis]|uniref:hypothetical protein n=1 Tax=Nonomuraea wenchangensis TaxID=568860 RepID=UPI003434449A